MKDKLKKIQNISLSIRDHENFLEFEKDIGEELNNFLDTEWDNSEEFGYNYIIGGIQDRLLEVYKEEVDKVKNNINDLENQLKELIKED